MGETRRTLLLLVRHGTTSTTGRLLPGRAPGLHLNDVGRAEAEAVAERIAAREVDAVFASPLERTQETARPIGERLDREIRTEPGLTECDFGDWTGKALAELATLPEWSQVQRSPSTFRFPGGESFAEMDERVASAVESLRERHRGGTVVAVSHADPIRIYLARALGMPLDAMQRLSVRPCSVSAVLLDGDADPAVLTVNSTHSSLAELSAR